MGQKIKPIGLRVGINRTWDSRWYAGRNYGELLHQDIELRSYLMDRLKQAAISRVVIERPAGRARVTIPAGRPGLIIGKKGQDIERLRAGRLGGAEIARTEWYREGRVPLHTLRAEVDYGEGSAFTTYGVCGIKVWVFKGEVMAHDPMAQDKRLAEQQSGPAPRSNG